MTATMTMPPGITAPGTTISPTPLLLRMAQAIARNASSPTILAPAPIWVMTDAATPARERCRWDREEAECRRPDITSAKRPAESAGLFVPPAPRGMSLTR
jgi:hypothetical protein